MKFHIFRFPNILWWGFILTLILKLKSVSKYFTQNEAMDVISFCDKVKNTVFEQYSYD